VQVSLLKVTVPVTLSKGDDGFFIEVETKGGQSAALTLNAHGPLTNEILSTWASEQMVAALFAKRRRTGLNDVTGTPVLEGDIVERFDLPGHTEVFGVVKWEPTLAAFIMEGLLPDEQKWHSQNLRPVQAARIVGNMFLNRDLLKPCKLA
jgi:hypothetical protein